MENPFILFNSMIAASEKKGMFNAVSREIIKMSRSATSQMLLRFKLAESPAEITDALKLRYQVYCLEKRWLQREQYPSGLEADSLDPFARQFICLNEKNAVIGTVRLILNSPKGFPIQDHPSPPITYFQGKQTAAEISRLIVAKASRSLKVSLGLYRILYAHSREHQIHKWYMTIEPKFLKWFQTMGVRFAVVGSASFFFGDKTIPVKCELQETFGRLQERNPDLFAWFSKDPGQIAPGEKII